MYEDRTLLPQEAIKLLALGLLILINMPSLQVRLGNLLLKSLVLPLTCWVLRLKF